MDICTLQSWMKFQGGKSRRGWFLFIPFLPWSSGVGKEPVVVLEGSRDVVMQIPAPLLCTTHPALGEAQQFQHHFQDFWGSTISQVVIWPVPLVLFWRNQGIFKIRGHHWIVLTLDTFIFYWKIGEWHSVLVNLKTVDFFFYLWRVWELTFSHCLTI